AVRAAASQADRALGSLAPGTPGERGRGEGESWRAALSPLTLPSPPGVPGGEGVRVPPSPPVLRGRGVGGEGESPRVVRSPSPCPLPRSTGGEGVDSRCRSPTAPTHPSSP